MKRLVLIVMVLSLMVPLLAREGQAAPTWYAVNIAQIGPDPTGASWMLCSEVNGLFSGFWFQISGTQQNTIVATALTAISNGKQVRIYAEAANLALCTGMVMITGP